MAVAHTGLLRKECDSRHRRREQDVEAELRVDGKQCSHIYLIVCLGFEIIELKIPIQIIIYLKKISYLKKSMLTEACRKDQDCFEVRSIPGILFDCTMLD